MTSSRSARVVIRVCAVIAGGVAMAGCGENKDAEGSGLPKAQPSPPIKVDQPGASSGNPGAVVIRLWSHLRDGMFPLALNAFDADVVEDVGRENFVGALGVAQGTATSFAPIIVRTTPVRPRSGGTGPDNDRRERRLAVVYVEGRGVQGATSRATFLLEETPFGWSILYDTLLDSSLRSFVATSRQFSPMKSERLAADPAAQAGAAVARLYQARANNAAGNVF